MKKFLSLALILLLAVSLLTACGGSSNSGSNAPQEAGGGNDEGYSAQSPEAQSPEAQSSEETAIMEKTDPSLPLIELSKGGVYEDDSICAELLNYEIVDIPALREGNFADTDPSYSHYMQLRFEITNKIEGNAKITISSISVNETVFTERSYSYSDINPNVIYNEYKIQFNKNENVELDPTAIETVRLHFFIYDASKGKSNYMEDPIYEGYLLFNTPQ